MDRSVDCSLQEKKMMTWLDGKFVRDVEARVGLLSHSLHYGGAVYEGIRFYMTIDSCRAIFRLKDHVERLVASATAMGMETYPVEMLMTAIVEAVQLSGLEAGYIRPMVFRGEGIGLMSANIASHTMIAVLPWADGPPSTRLVTSQFIRLHPRSTKIEVKAAGHYVNSYLAAAEARKQGADDALLCDWQGNVAETSVANVFFVKGERVFTPKRGNIFAGLTRYTVIELLKQVGVEVEECDFSLAQALFCDAMFVAGTATEVLPVVKLNDKQFDLENSTVLCCRNVYKQVVTGGLHDTPTDWLTYV